MKERQYIPTRFPGEINSPEYIDAWKAAAEKFTALNPIIYYDPRARCRICSDTQICAECFGEYPDNCPDFEDDGTPCTGRCSCVHYTDEDWARLIASWGMSAMFSFMEGITRNCFRCGRAVDHCKKHGRSTYAYPCGCRLWQGTPPKWSKKQ